MQIQFVEEGERLTALPQGRMDGADGDAFGAAVEGRIQPGTKTVTIDLDQLDFINFGGIRAFLRLARALRNRKIEVDFAHGNLAVREALDLAGLDDIFPFNPPYSSIGGSQNENRTP